MRAAPHSPPQAVAAGHFRPFAPTVTGRSPSPSYQASVHGPQTRSRGAEGAERSELALDGAQETVDLHPHQQQESP